MEVISKDSVRTKIAEDMTNRYPTSPIEDVTKELILHKAIVMLFSSFEYQGYDSKLTILMDRCSPQ